MSDDLVPCEGFTARTDNGNGSHCWRIEGLTQWFHLHDNDPDKATWINGVDNDVVPVLIGEDYR